MKRIDLLIDSNQQIGNAAFYPLAFFKKDKEIMSSRTHKQKSRVKKRDNVDDREDWRFLALNALERTYSENEPEYTSNSVKESNPEYGAIARK